jgi:very-short-patch-repair endonuclease
MPKAVALELLHDPTVNYALQQNDVPVIKQLRLTNSGGECLNDVLVRVEVEPAFASTWEGRVTSLEPGASYAFGHVPLQLSPRFLAELTERVAGTITVSVSASGQELRQETARIDVLAYDEWSGLRSLPEVLAAFVTPNHPVVEGVLADAAGILSSWDRGASLCAYQTQKKKDTLRQGGAIYEAIRRRGLKYISPPASFEQAGQKVRLAERILENGLGTCLDLALFLASCFEQAGLHPLVIFTKGHAFAGFWLVEETFSDVVGDDVLRLRKRVELAEICLVETTTLTSAPPNDFNLAVQLGKTKLENEQDFVCVVDVARCRKAAIRPLPLRGQHGGTERASSVQAKDGTTLPPDLSLVEGAVRPDGQPEEQPETPATRLDHWKRKLLDLSLRNRLLNFKFTNKAVQILCPDIASLEDALADGDKFEILAKPSEFAEDDPRSTEVYRRRTGDDARKVVLMEEFRARRLRAGAGRDKLSRQMLEIYREATLQLEEGGASTLYLALGFLAWYETPASQKRLLAPLILVPVEILRGSALEGFRLRKRDDEARINTTLLELMSKDFQLTLPSMDPVPQDDHGVDVPFILGTFREAVKKIDRWEVVEDACLGFFSFAKFLMWRDLEERTEELLKNPVVSHLVNTPGLPFPDSGGFPDAEQLDRTHSPLETFCPVLTDSSQLAAVYAAAEGKSFVLHGPPGTGKSQTITNLIAHCLACGKSVLFVSEKMAALTVVRDRLAQCGLENFCLELHSNKSSKQEVIKQLGQPLTGSSTFDSEYWRREAERLAALRAELDEYVHTLHKVQSSGETAFQGLSKLIGLTDVRHVALSWASPEAIEQPLLERLRQASRQLALTAGAIGTPAGHPWEGVACEDWSPVVQREVQEALENVPVVVSELERSANALLPLLGIAQLQPGRLDEYEELGQSLTAQPRPPAPMLEAPDWPALRREIEELVRKSRRRKVLWESLGASFTPELIALDLDALAALQLAAKASWGLVRWFKNRAIAKTLRPVSKSGHAPASDRFEFILVQARELRELESQWKAVSDTGARLLGSAWAEGQITDADLDALATRTTTLRAKTVKAAILSGRGVADIQRIWAANLWNDYDCLCAGVEAYCAACKGFRQAVARLDGLLGFGKGVSIASDSGETLPLERVVSRAALLTEHLGKFRLWCQWRKACHGALDIGLKPLVLALEQGRITPEQTEHVFQRGYYQWWVESVVHAEPVLRNFFSAGFEDKIRQFRETDERYTKLTRDEIHARLSARVPIAGAKANDDSEMGILNRQLTKKRSHMSIRALVQKIPNLLPRLKPCLLMSPMSIAQYMDAGHTPFDLVVFDEASQIPVWDAVGAIARGRQAIIVGDPKQLPPTNFFQREDDETETDEETVEDAESILDECRAASLPQLYLRWHYRSRNESLIAFSNHQYYDNSLLTFPSPQLEQAVSFRHVLGVYDKSKSRTNRIEADALVSEMVRRLLDPVLSSVSIGVVTFSQAQRDLIADLLEVERRNHPEVERFFDPENPDRVFIKNLENVQGDERDAIFFSVGYGPDAAGKVSMSFGPLNREGGERRLNVAVTRARKEVVLFSSLKPEQIDLARTRARGVQDLKSYMEYAERGMAAIREAIARDPSADFDSPFEQQVCEALRAKGHTVHAQVGCSGYRIDLAVVDPDCPGRYLLGIECDGANYHRSHNARDRDRLREMVLRGLGWEIARVWSTDWWQNPQAALEKVEAAIEEAMLRRTVNEEKPEACPPPTFSPPEACVQQFASAPASGQAARPTPDENLEKYRPSFAPIVFGTQEEYYQPQSTPQIRQALLEVMEREAPMSLTLLTRRVAARWGFTKATEKCKERALEVAKNTSEVLVRRSKGETFLWERQTPPDAYTRFRIPGGSEESQRDPGEISPEEIANAARHVLRQYISASRDVLEQETARLLGFRRVTQNVRAYMQKGIALLALATDIERDGENLVLK